MKRQGEQSGADERLGGAEFSGEDTGGAECSEKRQEEQC